MGTVIHIDVGSVHDEVTVMLDDNDAQIVAVITRARGKILGLDIGSRVVVLIRTHDVMLITDHDDVMLSARNQLAGTVMSIIESSVSADVRVRLDGGGIISSVITMESVREMELAAGTPVYVMVRANDVIIGALRDKR